MLPADAPQDNAFAFDYGTTAVVDSGDDESDPDSAPPQPAPKQIAFRLPFAVAASLAGKVPRTLRQHQVHTAIN